jgi:hypothetical protein
MRIGDITCPSLRQKSVPRFKGEREENMKHETCSIVHRRVVDALLGYHVPNETSSGNFKGSKQLLKGRK